MDRLVETAEKIAWALYGTPYIWGGKTINGGLDCSGFVQHILSAVGRMPSSPAENTDALYARFTKALTPSPGCLVFYGKPSDVSHVMFYIGDGLCIGACNGDSDTTTFEIAAKKNACVRVKPIGYRKDLVGFVDPFLD
jgi:cell wall-associated NlpC family hydrolase